MSVFNPTALPATIAAYFATSGNRAAIDLFAREAAVVDEGETHTGLEAITSWLDSVERRYRPRYVLQDASRSGTGHTVTFEVSGTFPGSPAILRQHFELNMDGKIRLLRTL
ncbi:nuclear transport factor 2 family protein [Devosia chinhatensis]|uniref:SnoaL-like domain-containing protein n=1 Tax=Devosia chinhatensis TaxID=429727 RepID=A0A0F5FHJ9_9HYPH|nr:nuclear transport factor 2 family protein [Devosia chinhatensis]KKB08273.1 hypothetical protein VE26_12790 [Devosia chinhatensis]